MKKIFFVIRNFNDIDHFTPLIHFLSYEKSFKIIICTFTNKNQLESPELDYLKNNLKFKIHHLIDNIDPLFNFLQCFSMNLRKLEFNVKCSKISNQLASLIEKVSFFFFNKKILNRIVKFINEFNPDIICFDYIFPVNNYYFHMAVNRSKNMSLISLPHGLMIFNELK